MTRQLRAKGFEDEQAEAITEAVRTGVTGGVATKADLAETEHRLRGEITEVRSELAEVRADLRWMKMIGAAILAVLVLPWIADLIGTTMPR